MVKLFGTTIKETIGALFSSVHLDGNGQNIVTQNDKIKAIGRLIVTTILLGFAIYLTVSTDNSELGSTIIGGIIGYWLK
jgi:phosphotransferase system  glucose/maltose/N-acetylglucosamine-specific IIC component